VNRQGAKAAKGFFGWVSGGLMLAGLGLVMIPACGGRESTLETTPGSGGASGGTGAGGNSGAVATEAGTDDWTACSGRDCVLVPVKCCASCMPSSVVEYSAVNNRYEDAFRSQTCQGTVACGPCAAPPPDVLSAQANFVALCESGRCQAVDLRSSRFSECKAATDCELQYGTGCCDGCGNNDLIAINPAANLHHEICGDIEPPCVPPQPYCITQRTGLPMAVCNATTGHCEVAGL